MTKIDNRGITLVELIIVMGLAAIVSLMAFSFLQDTTHYYNLTNAEVDIQMEAQTTYNQVRDLVMNSEQGVVAFGMETSSEDRELTVGGKEYSALVIYNNENIQAIIYDPTIKKMYMVEEVKSDVKYGNKEHVIECIGKISDDNLMSEGISSFEADTNNLNSVSSNRMLNMTLEVSKKGKTNKYESYVTMRNDNVVNPDEKKK